MESLPRPLSCRITHHAQCGFKKSLAWACNQRERQRERQRQREREKERERERGRERERESLPEAVQGTCTHTQEARHSAIAAETR